MKVSVNALSFLEEVLERTVKIYPNRLLTIRINKQNLGLKTARDGGGIACVDFILNINTKFSRCFVHSVFSQNLVELIEFLNERAKK
jgi:hypothetical protein